MEKYLYKSREEICDMLEKTVQSGINERNLEMFQMLLESFKDTYKIELYQKQLESDRYSRADGNYNHGDNMMSGGNSYRQQRRDSRGRYSRDGGGGGYSYDDGMEEVWEILEMMETGLPDDQREAIRRFRREMQR